jgi:hypothetical protein
VSTREEIKREECERCARKCIDLAKQSADMEARENFEALALVLQLVSNRHDQVAAKIVCGLSILIFDAMVAGVVAKWSVFEFTVGVLDNVSAYLLPEKIIKSLGCRRRAGKNQDTAVVFDRTRCNRIFDAIADPRQCHRSRRYLSVGRSGYKEKTN